MHALRWTAALAVSALPFATASLHAQGMSEHGHLAGGAASAAGAMRRTAPVAALSATRSALDRPSPSRTSERRRAPLAEADPRAAAAAAAAPGQPLAVLRVDWGAAPAEASAAPIESPRAEPEYPGLVLDPAGPAPPPDPAAAQLESGMTMAQIAQILGDPTFRAAGLAGRGYDEKTFFVTETGSQVIVFAANGIARDFVTVSSEENPRTYEQNMLPSAPAVVP